MLILKRNVGEQIIVNGDLIITVNSIDRYGVKLGFVASKEKYIVDRIEVHHRKENTIQEQKKRED